MLPAVGQGIVAVECAADDLADPAHAVPDRRSRRARLRRCRARGAVGAQRPLQFADRGHLPPSSGAQMSLTASVLDESRRRCSSRPRAPGPADRPRELGRAVGLELLAKGAAEIIERSRPRLIDAHCCFHKYHRHHPRKRMIQYAGTSRFQCSPVITGYPLSRVRRRGSMPQPSYAPAPASASARHARSAFPAGCRGRG